MDKLESFYRLIENPPEKYRSAPFWAWNDSINPEELITQIQEMHRQRVGGFFIHSREGLETEYLSDEWMDCVEASILEARKLGMEVWLYDEDKWPSGSVGGQVSAADPQNFTAKGLTVELITPQSGQSEKNLFSDLVEDKTIFQIYLMNLYAESADRLSVFFKYQPDKYQDLRQSDAGFKILICRMETSKPSEWYNNSAPTDNLNPDAVKTFLELTHEKYRRRFSADFGSTIKGFFSDEPNFCDFFSSFTSGRPWLPWSTVLPEYFKKKRGYDIHDILPLLFFHGPNEEKARYDYWLTLTELFIESYTKQLYTWCENNKCKLTGHVLYENDPGYSIRVSGASMPHYRYMHVPGIDLLGDQRQEYLTVKQCTSVANQFGNDTVLTETYGCTGWDFSFAGQKRLGDWQFVMGVNKRCQHLSLYSFSGCRKRDYPPSFNYHNSWWRYNHVIEDYFARLAVCVTEGRVLRDLLVIHPIGSLWMKSGSAMNEDLSRCEMNMGWTDRHITRLNKVGDEYNKLAEKLLMMQFDFDFGDELIMKNEGSSSEGTLTIGRQKYNTIIVPRVETLMESTLLLLEKFLRTGGCIYWVMPFPDKVDAIFSERAENMKDNHNLIAVDDYTELLTVLSASYDRPLRICDDFGKDLDSFLSMVRVYGSCRIYTIVNTESTCECDVSLHFKVKGRLSSYSPQSGKKLFEKVIPGTGGTGSEMVLQRVFKPEETIVFIVEQNEDPDFTEPSQRYRHPHRTEEVVFSFPSRTKISLNMDNAQPLDRCQFRKGTDLWEDEISVWQGQRKLRSKLGMPPIWHNGAPQRYTWINDSPGSETIPIGMRFRFLTDHQPEGPIYVAIEKSKDFKVSCNGEQCRITNDYYLDKALILHEIPKIMYGENILDIFVNYHRAVELEDIYLVGDFGVNNERVITATPKTLRTGDWSMQGLYHYPGSIFYHYSFGPLRREFSNCKLQLKLGAFAGTLAVIRINEGKPLHVFKGESLLSVGGLFNYDKENKVDIEIVGNLRNLLGPLHRSTTTCSRISWEDFRTEDLLYTPEYIVKPAGLLGEVAVIVEK